MQLTKKILPFKKWGRFLILIVKTLCYNFKKSKGSNGMNLKKFACVLVSCALIGTVFTGCGEEEKKSDATIKLGMLQQLNASEQEFNGFMKKIAETFALDIREHEVTFFENLNSMQMALESGQIDEISTYTPVADYLIARNPQIEILDGHTMEFIDAFCLALSADNPELQKAADEAIIEMRNDGTLENLIKTYITDLKAGSEPPAVAFTNFEDAEILRVAVTGDLPSLDLILADGSPAGFNTAVLAELGKRLHKNINLIQVDTAARAAALTSGQADIVFWAIVPVSEIIPANSDKPDGVELTSPYYRGKIVHIGLKK